MPVARPGAALRCALALSLAGLAVGPLVSSPANAVGTHVVISEVYGAGGNSGASLNQDFVELYNPTGATVDLSGSSIQYRSATGTANPTGVVPLTGSIPAGGYYLLALAKGTTGADLPTPDQTATSVNLSGTTGTVFLAAQTTALTAPPTGSVIADPTITDLVGFGSSNTFETAVAPAPSSTSSIARDAAGDDSNDNSTDLTAGAPTPKAAGGGTTTPPPTGVTPIADVQGTGTTSPFAGQQVTTRGVVTATYPTGGFNGFVIQTPGTGRAIDPATHHASDGLFVYLGTAAASAPSIGQYVEVTGAVSEFNGLTELTTTTATVLDEQVAAPTPATVTWPRSDADREGLESMLIAPQGAYTVTDNYSTNQYAEIGLAAGTTPLRQPTDVADAQDTAAIAAVNADNAARKVVLDDGASLNFLSATSKNTPLPWLTQDPATRVGAAATIGKPLVVDYRNNAWKWQPTTQLTATDAAPVTFSNTRQATSPATGGNVRIASFNVLNYFPTTGRDWEALGGTCTYYTDRAGEPVTVNTCTGGPGGEGPRGAADATDFGRQQNKIVKAINGLKADVVSLEEIENSARFGKDRDDAVAKLVAALNADAGAGTWDYVRTPSTAGDQSNEDVIRTAFIYHPAVVSPVGESLIDNAPAFDVARDPLAQAFQVGGDPATTFAVIVNHFKSKGSGVDDGTGQGNANPDRIAQAQELVKFQETVKSTYATDKVFLSGDFNSYTQEDPMQVLYGAGFTNLAPEDEYTYLFSGTVGSLDHVLANGPALAMVAGAHVWNINALESVALEYSRDNYNATDFYVGDQFRASDHDPLVVGINDQPRAISALTVTAAPRKVKTKKAWSLTVSAVPPADGIVRVTEAGKQVATGELVGGKVTIAMPPVNTRGTHTYDVSYAGSPDALPSKASVTVTFQ